MEDQSLGVRSRGRPSNEEIDQALIDAALKEFLERGFHSMTMEAIAARAGVSKVSLYRRWSSKSEIVAHVFRFLYQESPMIDHGSLEADVRALLKDSVGTDDAASRGTIFLQTLGEISRNPELMGLYRTHLLEPRIEQVRQLVKRAQDRGELRPDVDPDAAGALIGGPVFLYYLMLLTEAPVNLSSTSVEQLTTLILQGIAQAKP